MPADVLSWAPAAKVMNSFIIRLCQREGHPGFWEKLLMPEPSIRSIWEQSLEMLWFHTAHWPLGREEGVVWNGLWLRLAEEALMAWTFMWCSRLACLLVPPAPT